MLRGAAHSAFPLGLVYQLSLWVNRRKAVVFFVQISVVVSVVGTHVFLRVKCTHTPRLRTAYGMIHSYYSTTISCTKPSANDLFRFFAHRCQYKLSRRRARYSSECVSTICVFHVCVFVLSLAVLVTMYDRRACCGYSQKKYPICIESQAADRCRSREAGAE